ncbi:MAG: hypothetical protein LUO89_15340, partial [Methanothrix sp.]|nr:hypothetical protein [Methanothrix sp.]
MKSLLVWLWLGVSVLFFALAGCSGDTSTGPDAQADAKVDGTVDAGGDVKSDVVTTSFNVTQAASLNATRMTVTFDAPPDPAQAVVLANYAVPNLTLSAPSLNGNTVTLTTSAQTATQYTVTVTGVTRASDAKTLTKATADFTGRTPFDVTAAASVDSQTMTVTFDAPPNATQATTLASYSVQNLTLSGTPQLNGNTVTLTTSNQGSGPYQITVSNVTRASDGEPLLVNQASFAGTPTFNVASALSTGNTQMTVTFDAPPDPTQATTLASYSVQGLTLSAPQLSGNVVTLTTTPQTATQYQVTVTGVTRASDSAALVTNQATFTGRTSFNVASAVSTSTTSFTVTFDAPPTASQATTLANYTVQGLTLTGTPVLSGSTVTITTQAQSATKYTVTVSNVTRASDTEPLATTTADFDGRTPFDVSSAQSTSAVTMTVTFDAAPNTAQATTLGNYAVQGLTLTGTPVLNGNTVSLLTSAQTATSYQVVVSNVTRASDGEALTTSSANFTGTAVQAPTVTNVVVTSTSPNNGTTPYNTGTVTVKITGTDFATVTCPTGVKLDDLDGAGNAASTQPTSCTVDSDTQ